MSRASRYDEHRARIIELITEASSRHARPPTVRHLAESCEVGVATMHGYLSQLSQEGVVEWQPKSHRSLRLTPAATPQPMSSTAPPA